MWAPRGLIVAIASVALATACSSGDATRAANPYRDQSPSATAPADEAASTNEPLWTVAAKPVGQPMRAGEVAVVLLRARGDELDVAGFDIESGEELWRHPWSPGSAPSGQAMTPRLGRSSAGEELVVFQRPETNLSDTAGWRAPLVAVSAATGLVVHQTDDVLIYEPLFPCLDFEDICASGSIDGATRATLRFDLDDGTLTEDQDGYPGFGRSLGPAGLYGRTDSAHERIGRMVDGEVVWEVAASDLFGPGYGSGGGWWFVLDVAMGVYVGTIGSTAGHREVLRAYRAGESVTRPIDDAYETLVFDADTGQRLWREEGTTAMCLMPASYVDGRVARSVRCRMTGFVTASRDKPTPVFDQLRVSVEGYDLETGKTTWTRRVPRATGEKLLKGEPDLDSNGNLVISEGDDLLSLSLATGATYPTPRTSGGHGLCRKQLAITYALASRGLKERLAGTLLFVCDANGDPAPADELDLQAVQSSGMEGPDDVYVIAHKDGLRAWRITESA